MSDAVKHECGIAYIRLLQPLSYYQRKYHNTLYGISKLYLLMEKQHNRGQDGAGLGVVKLNMPTGQQSSHRYRISGANAIAQVFQHLQQDINLLEADYPGIIQQPEMLKGYCKYAGEVLLGHLRYGTQGKNNIDYCHPFVKHDVIPGKHLTIAGNFNLTNIDDLYSILPNKEAQHGLRSDLNALIELMHHYLSIHFNVNTRKSNLVETLKKTCAPIDGGYTFAGLVGNGDSFIMRDAHGIRPCFYYQDNEIVAVASERAALMTTFHIAASQVQELPRGSALMVSAIGVVEIVPILEPASHYPCSFERIYFSRGSDPDIYQERMKLGNNLAPEVLNAVEYDLKHTIVSFIPNTAETAFYGLIKGMEDYLKHNIVQQILAQKDSLTEDQLAALLNQRVRIEKIAIKDAKLRTFITEDAARSEMVQHVYDITYGTVAPGVDTLIIIDDSIVRGTTLRESIFRMLFRLQPKKIIIVSSAPQIRYPDCYGIDMSKLNDFIAFEAAVALLKERGLGNVLTETYALCLQADQSNTLGKVNYVKNIYAPFTYQEISQKIATLLKPGEVSCPISIIYQTLEGLHNACPNHKGDWYFTGNYPTAGGNRVANRAFMNYIEKRDGRGY
ncbi:MAG: amidophosphoribosyltransferase [Chitinophagia bacterium]|nr:amidophosphoribosyltransferase [Chitinophagia bacterium]